MRCALFFFPPLRRATFISQRAASWLQGPRLGPELGDTLCMESSQWHACGWTGMHYTLHLAPSVPRIDQNNRFSSHERIRVVYSVSAKQKAYQNEINSPLAGGTHLYLSHDRSFNRSASLFRIFTSWMIYCGKIALIFIVLTSANRVNSQTVVIELTMQSLWVISCHF